MTWQQMFNGLALLATLAPAEQLPDWRQEQAVMDSLSHMPARLRGYWLDQRGLEVPGINAPLPTPSGNTEDVGLRLAGKWGRGPAVEVTGRDSWVYVALGSEAAIINFANPDSPKVVAEVQAQGLVAQVAVEDSFLYIGCRLGTVGIEVWNIRDPSTPVFRGRASTALSDFCVKDTFAYVTLRVSSSSQDTFKVYNLADPANPRLIGWYVDSGDKIAVSGNNVVVCDWYGMHIVDVSDPTHPHCVGTIGIDALGVDVRGNLVCAAKWWNGDADNLWLDFFDISNPAAPRFLAEIDSVGGFDIHFDGPLAFVSGFYYGVWQFAVVDIQDSTRPRLVSTCGTPGDNFGVWADWTLGQAHVADSYLGLTVIDISNLNAPRLDTSLMGAGLAVDLAVHDSLMFVATSSGGLQIVCVADPARPQQLFAGRGMGDASVAAGDSYAYLDAYAIENLRVLDVTNPRNPVTMGGVDLFNEPEDMVIRDSFVYCAECRRFQIVNVARPRQPVLVGSCVTTDGTQFGLVVKDTFAYIAADRIQVINVARPDSPRVVTTIGRASWDLSIVDSILFCEPGPAVWYSLANPAVPAPIDSIDMGHWITGMTAVNRTIYACSGPSYSTLYAISIADLHQPRVVAQATLPYTARRIVYAAPYLYVACWDAGVCIFESTQTAIAEPRQPGAKAAGVAVRPSIARGRVMVRTEGRRCSAWSLWDAAGRVVLHGRVEPGRASWPVDLASFPTGAYWLEVRSDKGISRTKLIRP